MVKTFMNIFLFSFSCAEEEREGIIVFCPSTIF
jgi:hypothetical protein